MHDKVAPSVGRRIERAYSATALITTTTLILFVLINLAALLVPERSVDVSRRPATPYERAWLIESYGLDTLARGYPGLSHDDVRAFLYETSNWFQAYEPFTGFRPVERHDRFISIDRDGFRPVPNQARWPPDKQAFTVFLFGGSTMMGAGVPDDQTIAAHMQRAFDRCRERPRVYNFGRGFYFSTQERILFEQLLLSGAVPNAAVFLDGLNDFYFADGIPQFSDQFRQLMANTGREPVSAPSWREAISGVVHVLPMWRLAVRLGLASNTAVPEQPAPVTTDARSDEERIAGVIDRWTRNRELIEGMAQRFGVRVSMIWQPVPTYAYDITKLNVYRPNVDLFGAHRLSGLGYPRAAARFAKAPAEDRILWLGDIQRHRSDNLYVDAVHYTGAFSSEIATAVATFLTSNAIVPCTS